MAVGVRSIAPFVVAVLVLTFVVGAASAQGYDSTTGASAVPSRQDDSPDEQSTVTALESYSQQCVVRIRRLMAAQSPDLEDGAVAVQAVRIARDGLVLSIDAVGQSGHPGLPGLDRFARRVIQQASPFPPVPQAVAGDLESVTIELGFTVREGSVRVE